MLSYRKGLNRAIFSPDLNRTENFDFSRNTTYGLGGTAELAYCPHTIWQAKAVFDALKRCSTPYTVLGCGSNVLVSDFGYGGAVISTKNLRGTIRLSPDRLLCLAGTRVAELLAYCRKRNLGGLEYLYGIPASMGGVAYMNAGVGGDVIANNVESVRVYDGKDRVLSAENCNFLYRHSTMRDINALILAIIVKVNSSNPAEIDKRITYYMNRREHLPRGKSCGCVFKNPPNLSAGELIDRAGLKLARVGGAFVSDKHASFIINDGGTASDVRALIKIVKERVLSAFGISLEEEVVYIGEFYDTDS